MLSGLKRKCASHLVNFLNNENVFEFFKLSRLYDLKKFEFSCITHLANNLIEVIIKKTRLFNYFLGIIGILLSSKTVKI